jgi:N-acetylmuramoyl-L-alanine amidase
MPIEKIYLHWTAGSYNSVPKNAYHTVIKGTGEIIRVVGYDQTMNHTYRRNTNSVGLSCACMINGDWKDSPPTQKQVENMCREAAELAKKLGWTASDITDLPNVSRVMTHAEAGSNRDFSETLVRLGTGVSEKRARELGLPHDNYGPSWHDDWPRGLVERIDFWQVKKSDTGGLGGDILRSMIREFMGAPTGPSPLAVSDPSEIFLNGTKIADGRILSDNRLYVKLVDIIDSLGIKLGKVQGGDERFINLLSDKFTPKFLADSPLVPSFLTVDIYLNRPVDSSGIPVGIFTSPIEPFMGGILIDKSTYILINDFCNELDIDASFQASDKSYRMSI